MKTEVRAPHPLGPEFPRYKLQPMASPPPTKRRPLVMAVLFLGVAMMMAGAGWAAFERFSQTAIPDHPDRFGQIAAVVPTFTNVGRDQPDASLAGARDKIAAAGTPPAAAYGVVQQDEPVRAQTEEEPIRPRTEIALAPAAVSPEPVPPPAESTAPPALPPAAPPPRQIDPEELAVLMKQAADFIAAGDFISARLIFLRAAEARNPEAALAVGATYDPITIEQFGARGLKGDIEKAREWYRKAEEFGSTVATRRLELLALRER